MAARKGWTGLSHNTVRGVELGRKVESFAPALRRTVSSCKLGASENRVEVFLSLMTGGMVVGSTGSFSS